jgi:hypothetical protein
MDFDKIEGIQTIESITDKLKIKRQSAINLIFRLKKKGLIKMQGGGKQVRLYKISKNPIIITNGFYDMVNKYSKEKLNPTFNHIVNGRYTIEDAIIDGINIGGSRTLDATSYLFNHIKNWKRLFSLATQKGVVEKVYYLYEYAKKNHRVRKMPKRYVK